MTGVAPVKAAAPAAAPVPAAAPAATPAPAAVAARVSIAAKPVAAAKKPAGPTVRLFTYIHLFPLLSWGYSITHTFQARGDREGYVLLTRC